MTLVIDRLKNEFNHVLQNGKTYNHDQFEVILDTNMNNEVELNRFAVNVIEQKNILIENVLLYFENEEEGKKDRNKIALNWSGMEHFQDDSENDYENKFLIYLKNDLLYKQIKKTKKNLKMTLVDCFINYNNYELDVSLQTDTIAEYNFINDNQELLIYELPTLKRYIFDKEMFQINYNDIKVLNFKAIIKQKNKNDNDDELFEKIPIKLTPNMDVTIKPPIEKMKTKKYKLINKILDHDNKYTIYLSKHLINEIDLKDESILLTVAYMGKKYKLNKEIEIKENDSLKNEEICINFMSCLSVDLQVAGSPKDIFILTIEKKEEVEEGKLNNIDEISIKDNNNFIINNIPNPPITISLPDIFSGIYSLIHPNSKSIELSRLRFEFLINGYKCIYVDTPFLQNLLKQGDIPLTTILDKYVFGIDNNNSDNGGKKIEGETIFELLKLFFKKLNQSVMIENTVILITCCDFVFETNDTKEENDADFKNDITYLKWQKLFLKISEILDKKTLILQFENEQSIPDFFKRLYLLDKTITNLQIDYKTEKRMSDYRDCINISKLTSYNGNKNGLKYVPLNQRETTSQHTPKETHKPLYGFKEIINKIKSIYETPNIYSKLYNQFPKMNKHMLLYGAPSMGKSLLIKHLPKLLEIGDSTSISWRYVNALSLISKYTGESERNVRDLFTEARSKIKQNLENNNNEKEEETDINNITSLSFIIIDNIQTLLPTRSETATITDRLVNTFLTELDGIDSNILNEGLVVIGTTNRPDLVDPALVRPGRLENKIKIDYNVVDWEEIVSNGMKDYFNEEGLKKDIEKDIVTLVKTKKCSIGTFLGALYEVKLELEEEEEEENNKLDYNKILSLLNEKLVDENDIYMHFEKLFRKFDNTEDEEEDDEYGKRIGVEMAFA